MTDWENLTSALAKLSEVAQNQKELLGSVLDSVQKQIASTTATEKVLLNKLKEEAISRNADQKTQENIQNLSEICDQVMTESNRLVATEKDPEYYAEEMTKTVKIFEQVAKIVRVRNNLSSAILKLPAPERVEPKKSSNCSIC